MNILIKLTCLIGLVIAPILGNHDGNVVLAQETSANEVYFIDAEGNKTILTEKQIQYIETGSTITEGDNLKDKTETMVEMLKNDNNNQVTTNVTITKTVDGRVTTETKTFTGTEEEVRAQLKDVDGMKIKIKDKE